MSTNRLLLTLPLLALPVVLYPLLMIGFSKLQVSQQEATESRTSRIALWGTPPAGLRDAITRDGRVAVDDGAGPPEAVASGLAAGTLLLVTTRFALTFAEKERALRVLHLRATTDPLTDLPNHREFHERLRAEVERARRHGRELSVVVIDIDHFKLVNDEHGHLTGDATLRAVAEKLREHARAIDVIARIGGEEFAWLMPQTGMPGARVAERIGALRDA